MGRSSRPRPLIEIEEMAAAFLEARRDHWHNRYFRWMGNHIARRLGILLPSPDRFWSQVGQAEGDGCWEWRGATNSQTGYGQLSMNGELWTAHRMAYTLAYGPIPKGVSRGDYCVCHHCDNRRCVRPDHLFLGTQFDNMRDRDRKGRGRNGRTGRIAA